MGLDVLWKDEMGDVLEDIPDLHNDLSRLVQQDPSPIAESVCLRFLDPYGDTMLNQYQIPHDPSTWHMIVQFAALPMVTIYLKLDVLGASFWFWMCAIAGHLLWAGLIFALLRLRKVIE